MFRALLIVLTGLLALLIATLVAVVLWVDVDDYRDTIAERASSQLGREVALQGPVTLRLFPWLALEINDLRVGNPTAFDEAPDLAHIGQATVSVRVLPLLKGQLETGAITLQQAQIHLITDRQGRSNLDGLLASEDPDASGQLDLSTLELGALRLDEVTIALLDLNAGTQTRLHIDQFRLEPFAVDRATPFRLRAQLDDGEAAWLQLASVEGELTANSALDRINVSQLVAEFQLPEMTDRGSLRGAAALHQRSDRWVLDLPVLDLIMTVDGLRLGLRAEAPLTIDLADPIEVALPGVQLSVNEQALSAQGTLQLSDPLRAQLSISGQRLDLVPILAAITDPAASQAMAEPTALDEQIDFAPLRRLDLDLQLDLQELIMSPQLRLTEVTTRAQLREGQLSVSPLQAVLFGGRFAGTMRVDFREDIPQVILEPTLSAIDVARVLRLATPLAPLTGQGDLRLRLKFSGLTLNEVLSSLDGSGEYSLTDGTLVGLDLRALLEQDLSQPSFRQITRSLGGETPFRALSGQVSVNAGVVALPDLALLASDYGMAGQGQIDLAANALNYRLTVQLGERLTAQLPRTLRELTGGSIPLQLAGPISQPQVTIDLGNVVERSLRRELEDRLLRPRQPDASDDVSETDPEAEAPRERGRDRLLRELRELLRDGPPNQ